MNIFKKSLRAKFTFLLLVVGVVPLAIASAFFYHTAKEALFENVFKELKWNADELTSIIEDYFEQSGKDLLIASKNAAFSMYFQEPGNRAHWVLEQNKTLKYLRSIYPDMVDEACFIDSNGVELSRIVYDRVAHSHELDSGEERSSFFKGAFELSEGEIFQGRPVVSEDTKRWVLPNATLVLVNGKKAAILHFEVTMTYFQGLLRKLINPDRGYGFILNDSGEFMAHTLLDISETEPFPRALKPDTPQAISKIYARMIAGESGIEQFFQGGKDYYIVFKPINASYLKGRNENRWSLAYVLPSDRVYVELDILRYNIIAIIMTTLLAIILSYIIGNYVTKPIRELAAATYKVSAGEMPRIEVTREDEIGTLSRSFNSMVESVKKRDEALKALAVTDGLTGLFNYRYFKGELEKEVKKSDRYNRPLSLIMADVDFFKHYNDTNGHAQGDMALKRVAEIFMKCVRDVDLAARYGGEEFAVVLPETTLEQALVVAERIRRKLEEEDVPYEELQPNGQLTLSIGVASFPDTAKDASELIDAADKALYKAKENGRNQVKPA